MKAYILGIRDDPDQGNLIVFANNATQAKSQTGDLMYDRWIDIQALRIKEFDGKENLTNSELALAQWHYGWRWFDSNDVPEEGEATDEQFLEWWHKEFDRTCTECKKTNEFVRYRFCGYTQEIHGRYQYELVCDDCEHEHMMDI